MARTVRGVLVSERECAILDSFMMRGLRELHLRDGCVPRELAEAAAEIHQAAKEYRASVLVEPSSATVFDRAGSVARSSEATERLSVQEAARLTSTSESYMRRLARRGVVTATRSGSRGEWQLDGGSLAAWLAERSDLRKAG